MSVQHPAAGGAPPAESSLLVVDDEAFNRELLARDLRGAGYRVTEAEDGEAAWALLDGAPDHFAAVLLDIRMPRLDGMGLLTRLKEDGRFAALPVILQTAIDDQETIARGIEAGAFYYLVKPFDKAVLLAIVQSAVSTLTGVPAAGGGRRVVDTLLRRAEFSLRTLEEARQLAEALAALHPDPERAQLGLAELLINAVEHGNLGITYAEKSSLLREARWEEEVARRLASSDCADKRVQVVVARDERAVTVTITDEGAGFDWNPYLTMAPERAFDLHGRGIAMSCAISFDTVEYHGAGNRVTATTRYT